ncbi:unnamed protein product [Soboliphyme baturini]|uniref:CX domain-containing protein n=1 Tax=Soboliphyme baturini TaxID=241478 RepID=A0A183IFW7_9BILA|nr:unnamed protein product [Soboliphyme baturini]
MGGRVAWLLLFFLCLPSPVASFKFGKKPKHGKVDSVYKSQPKHDTSHGLSYVKNKGRLHGLMKNPRTKGILAGLIAGYAAYKVGKATSKLFRNGMYYYMGDRYYPGPGYGKITCQYQVEEGAQNFNAFYEDKTPVRRILFE